MSAPPAEDLAAVEPTLKGVAGVLVVDDTEGNRYTVSRLLRDVGMRVTEAETAAEAMLHLATTVPDLVVLDINLPDASGHDVCRAIKSDPRTAAVPVMHVSASYVSNADRAYGLEHGADAYLTHPLDPAVFVATARALLRAEVERVRLYQVEHEARRAAEGAAARATLLQDLTAALARTMSASEVSQVVLTRAFAALGALGGLLVVSGEDGTLELLGAADVPEAATREWRSLAPSAAMPAAEAVRVGAAVSLASRAAISARYPVWERALRDALPGAPHALHAAPMIVDRGAGQRVLGAILLLFAREEAVDAETAALIGAVADQGATALERARLYESERLARAAAEAARSEAEQANAVKAQFLTMMSHELRTPLNAIGGYAELLELGLRGPVTAEQREDLRRIRQSQEHLLGLINSVLNFAKLEAGRVEYRLEATPLAESVRAVEALIAPLANAHGLAFDSSACDSSVIAHADGEKLRQVILNLLSNAVKFTDPGGHVAVSCERLPVVGELRRVAVRVADTGRGIAPGELTRVFDPFVQVGRRLSSTDGGTGLGLAISRDLARGMGGDLTVVSTLGVGSTFTLVLPEA